MRRRIAGLFAEFWHGAWRAPVLLVGFLLAAYAISSEDLAAWRYDRAAILAGETWRLLTGHLVHGDPQHLAWNLAGVLIVGFLFARDFTSLQWAAVLFASTAAIDLGFLTCEPQLAWYVGFSGVLHGAMAAGLVRWLRRDEGILTWLIGGVFVAKLTWEHLAGALPFIASGLSLPVVHEAHSYGAIGGAVAALSIEAWSGRRRRRGLPSL
jgi:rhomboid family GlyGly-CTERM serine protease